MTFVYTAEFLSAEGWDSDKDGPNMLAKIRQALKNITGSPAIERKEAEGVRAGFDYRPHPFRLMQDRDNLLEDWKEIWRACTLEFDAKSSGASIDVRTRSIRIGPFFPEPRFTVRDFEKIILHEFMHAAFNVSFKDAHHGMMEQILIHNLHYQPPTNLAECD